MTLNGIQVTASKPTRAPDSLIRMVISNLKRAFRDCVKYQWTFEQYSGERAVIMQALSKRKLTRAQDAQVFGASSVLFDLVNDGIMYLEWRLGTADISTAKYGWNVTSKPTHGAHFWRGSDKPFSEWRAL